jgi:hypothetical protein
MGMDRLKCQSVDGVMRELLMFALIYNEVCRCRSLAAAKAGVDPIRVSFVDTLRAMQRPGQAEKIWPLRPPRTQPRQLKRAHSEFRIMTRPRADIIEWIEKHEEAAN